MVCFYRYGFDWMTLISFVFSMVLMAISMIDLDTMIIPDRLNVCVLMIAILSMFLLDVPMMDRVIGALAVSVPMFLLNFLIPDCFGGGDIKLLAACGLMLGWKKLLVGMFIAVLLAGVVAIYLMITKKVDRKGHMAFGPYICIGMFVSLLYGYEILGMYLSLFGL